MSLNFRRTRKQFEALLHSFLESNAHLSQTILDLNSKHEHEILVLNESNAHLSQTILDLNSKHENELSFLSFQREQVAEAFHKRVDTTNLFLKDGVEIQPFKFDVDINTAKILGEIFTNSGTDKSTRHGYENFYSHIISESQAQGTLVEIGVGSKNKDLISHMKEEFLVAASLAAWSKVLPNWKIIGIDIDPECALIQSENYEILIADQRSKRDLEIVLDEASITLIDIAIDDGLHEPSANLTSLKTLWPRLKPNGIYVIEDIPDEHLSVWSYFLEELELDAEVRVIESSKTSKVSFDSNLLFFRKLFL